MSSPPLEMAERPRPSGAGDTSGFGAPDLAVLRALIDAIPARAVFVDTAHRYRYVNREFLDFVGLPEEEVVGRHIAEVLGQAVYDSYGAIAARVEGGEPFRWEGWANYEGRGGRRYVQESLTPYAPNGGPLQGVIAVGRDLTDLKERERELSERISAHEASEAIHAAVVASALDCIIVIDEAGRVVEFNPAAEATFGHRRADVVGQPIGELIVPPELRARHAAGLAHYIATGTASVLGRRIELEAVRANGSRLPVELAITEVSTPRQRLFTAHLRDLTEAHRARAEIEQQRDALYQSDKLAALGSLLAGIAHELNNPLSIVIGQALMMREAASAPAGDGPRLAEFAERAAKIEAAASRCGRIVRTFLAMARQRRAERREVDLATLVDGAVELLAYGLRTAGIEVVRTIPPGLPSLWADGDQLHQVVVNLIVNARQALEEVVGPRRIAISATLDRRAVQLVLTVADSGPGVPEPIRSRIFDPFFTTKPQGVGTGIGLAVSRGLIEAHGGSLGLAPASAGSGATFIVRLPLGDAAARSGGDAEAGGGEAAAAPAPVARRRALVVDDEGEIAGLLAEMLGRLGFVSDLAASGAEAMARLAAPAADYDVILCDIRMPDGDGPTLFAWLEAERPHLTRRIAFVTGDTLGPAAGRFLARTGCPVVEKPFLPDDIARLVELLTIPDADGPAGS